MDVSVVDPESVLVDFETVEAGDISGELDEAWLKTTLREHGHEDKVMVSVRCVLSFHPNQNSSTDGATAFGRPKEATYGFHRQVMVG